MPKNNDRLIVGLIGLLSILIPVVVSILLFVDLGDTSFLGDVSFLPTLNAIINSTVSVLLVLGLVFIKRKMVSLHRLVMLAAFLLSVIFLVSYVTYHYVHGDVKYTGVGMIRTVYLLILLTHILCSIAVVPLALFALYRAFAKQWDKHRRIVRFTWPIWLYVSVTGVIVYLMLHVYN